MGIMDVKHAAVPAQMVRPMDTLIVAGQPVTVTSVKSRWVRPKIGKVKVVRIMIHAGCYVIHTNPETVLIKRYGR